MRWVDRTHSALLSSPLKYYSNYEPLSLLCISDTSEKTIRVTSKTTKIGFFETILQIHFCKIYRDIYANLISTSILYWHPNVDPNLGYFSWWLEFTPRYLSLSQNKEAYITSFLSNKCWIIYKVFTLIDNWGWKLKQFPKLDHKIFHANTEQFCFIFHFQTRNLWTFAKIWITTVLQKKIKSYCSLSACCAC